MAEGTHTQQGTDQPRPPPGIASAPHAPPTSVLTLAVVGHTNVGKTSLLRTLTRDVRFGEVSPHPGTTRHVEGARLTVEGEPWVVLLDTPGLEDAIALQDHLAILAPPAQRLDGPARLERLLASPAARGRFEQETKVLRQLLTCDAALVVIDAREPVLAKYRDELALLVLAGRPLLPVLNFVGRGSAREAAWQEALSRLGLHARVRFDTVAPALDGERLLYQSLALMLEPWRAHLERLVEALAEQRTQRRLAGARLVAELVLDVAACRRTVSDDAASIESAMQRLREDVRAREQRCVEALLQLYAFRPQDAQPGELPALAGRWDADLFHPETLRQVGIRLGGGAAAGAAVGAGLDLMVGGLSLGAATALGAALGGGWQVLRTFGQRVLQSVRGRRELTVDDAIVRLLALRQGRLLDTLDARGHAATQAITLDGPEPDESWRRGALPGPVRAARGQPGWSTLGDQPDIDDPLRRAQVQALATLLMQERTTPGVGQDDDSKGTPAAGPPGIAGE